MKRIYFALLATLYTAISFAQNSSGGADVNVDVTKSTGTTTASFP
jgi:hypothetical protein